MIAAASTAFAGGCGCFYCDDNEAVLTTDSVNTDHYRCCGNQHHRCGHRHHH